MELKILRMALNFILLYLQLNNILTPCGFVFYNREQGRFKTKTLREDAHCAQEGNGRSRAPAQVCVGTHTFLLYRKSRRQTDMN